MSQEIAPDPIGSRAALNLLEAPHAASASLPSKPNPPAPLADRELASRVQLLAPAAHGRRRIWEFDRNLHCSIIGTCLTNAELRQALAELGLKEAETATEHDLHKSGVLLAGRRHDGAKLLQKGARSEASARGQLIWPRQDRERGSRIVAGGGTARRDPGRLLGGADASGDQ